MGDGRCGGEASEFLLGSVGGKGVDAGLIKLAGEGGVMSWVGVAIIRTGGRQARELGGG